MLCHCKPQLKNQSLPQVSLYVLVNLETNLEAESIKMTCVCECVCVCVLGVKDKTFCPSYLVNARIIGENWTVPISFLILSI